MRILCLFISVCCFAAAVGAAPPLERTAIDALLQESCLDCHDDSTETNLDITALSNRLNDADMFRKWERLFDRVAAGEMPPEDAEQPRRQVKSRALDSLKKQLTAASRTKQRQQGRVVLRRLNRTEYENTLHDLLGIRVHLAGIIPAENASGYDTVADSQGLSPLHIASYLDAADQAIDAALNFGPAPPSETRTFEFKQLSHIRKFLKRETEGRLLLRELDDAIVMFLDANWIFRLQDFNAPQPGKYRIKIKAYSVQTDKVVVLRINAGNHQLGSHRIVGSFDLSPGKKHEIEMEAYLDRNDYLYPSPDDLVMGQNGKSIWEIEAPEYEGAGVAVQSIEVTGPLNEAWPPESVSRLLRGIEVRELEHPRWINSRHVNYEIVPGDNPRAQLQDIVGWLAPRAFRRPLLPNEEESFVDFGMAALDAGRTFDQAIRVTCRSIFCSPHFLFLMSGPGKLDDYELASRLSYFLWKSVPDNELFRIAKKGKLDNAVELRKQVDRMLASGRSRKFVVDFCDQWLLLNQIDATTPDKRLYPEYDPLLKHAMLEETRQFLLQLIREDLGVKNLVHSDFAMLNRRLAEHYEIDGVAGQNFRKVDLGDDSLRGGLLSQASILKVTANGTVTSPVRRGAWVLDRLLGEPPAPPPPDIGSIDPDTRGTTTVREELAKHRDNESCAACHRDIDPPGFAMECFDVIGGFRNYYRSLENGEYPDKKLQGRKVWEYRVGPDVDATGELPDGRSFDNFAEYRELLLENEEQIARNVISQLIVYATGSEIQFADRDEVERILQKTKATGYGFRSIIHEVVQSRIFKLK
jgi:hypothetical protein